MGFYLEVPCQATSIQGTEKKEKANQNKRRATPREPVGISIHRNNTNFKASNKLRAKKK